MEKNEPITLSREEIMDLLFDALRAVYKFERIEVETFNLTYQQIYLLKILKRRSPLRVSDIAAEMKIQVFAATRLIDQLEERKFIARRRDNEDKRNIFVVIEPEGEEMAKKIEEHAFTMLMENLPRVQSVSLDTFVSVIKSLDTILGVDPKE